MSGMANGEWGMAKEGRTAATASFRVPRSAFRARPAGFSLLEMIIATTISGLVALAVLTSMRIGIRAWEKEQQAVVDLRRTANVQDIVQFQVANYQLRQFVAELPDRRQMMHYFFGEERRLVLLSSYSALQRGRGGFVSADYACEMGVGGKWALRLHELPIVHAEELTGMLLAMVPAEGGGLRPLLRPFDRQRSLLLWEGLDECRFFYLGGVPQPEWTQDWSLIATPDMPDAIWLDVRVDRARWKGLAPVPVVVRTGLGGVPRG